MNIPIIPESYIVDNFYLYAGFPRFKRHSNIYEGCCPICNEGSSWGKKRRLYYIVNKNLMYCHNCGWSSTPIRWISKVSGKSFVEIINENKTKHIKPNKVSTNKKDNHTINSDVLPNNSIDLFNPTEIKYYQNNQIVKEAIKCIKKRNIINAINKPNSLYVCIDEKSVHKNRIIIPFYYKNKIIFYQSRSIFNKEKVKYLSKIASEKSLFNYDNIKQDIKYIFITEGPFDSFFIKNGIAVGGIQKHSKKTFTPLQDSQIKSLIYYNIIWVLDNQYIDNTSKEKTKILLDKGYKCFIWTKENKDIKDINDLSVVQNKNEIDYKFILKHSYSGLLGKIKLNLCNH